jgi:hypothetical protein
MAHTGRDMLVVSLMRGLSVAVTLLAAVALGGVTLNAQPLSSAQYFGRATQPQGQPVRVGSRVEARIGLTVCGETIVTAEGLYSVDVLPATERTGCGVDGAIVRMWIAHAGPDGVVRGSPVPAPPESTFRSGARIELDIQIAPGSSPPPSHTVALVLGCNNVALTFPVGQSTRDIARSVFPADAVVSIWLYSASDARFIGYAPDVPSSASDYTATRSPLEAVFVCMRAPGTLTQPGLQP